MVWTRLSGWQADTTYERCCGTDGLWVVGRLRSAVGEVLSTRVVAGVECRWYQVAGTTGSPLLTYLIHIVYPVVA